MACQGFQKNKFWILNICIIAGLILGAFSIAHAAFNEQINFQGKLTDTNNMAVEDDDYNFEFKLWSDESTTTESYLKWTETCTSTKITVTDGLFSHLLGSITALNDSIFNQTLWLEVRVGGTTTNPTTTDWETLSPRKKLGAVPAAFEAKRLEGYATSSFAMLADNETITGAWTFNNILSITSSTASTTLTVQQDGAGNIVDFKDGGTSVFVIANGGNVTVAGNILPATTTAYNIGSSGYKWANIYAATATIGSTITIGADTITGSGNITISNSTGDIILNPASYLSLGIIATGTWQGTAIGATYGGTGLTALNRGDILIATTSSAFYRLATGTEGQVLKITSGMPIWGTDEAGVGGGADTDWIISTDKMYATTTVSYVGIGTITPSSILDVYATSSAVALTVQQDGAGNIIDFKNATGSVFTVSGSGNVNIAGDVTLAAEKSLILTGGGSLPGSPNEGEMFFSTSTKQLYIYADSKWQADRTIATKIVAATSSQNYEKADYVCSGASCEDEINQAISDLPASGGAVYLLEGTYIMATSTYSDCSVKATSSLAIVGSGAGTVLKIKDSFNADLSVICNLDTVNGNFRTLISNFKLDGNKTNNSAGDQHGIYFEKVGTGTSTAAISGTKIEKLWVENFRLYGIWLNSSSNNTIANNTVQGNGGYGIILYSFSNNNTVINNTSQGNSDCGILLHTSSTNNTVAGNIVQGNGNNGGIRLEVSSDNTITGNTVQGNVDDGIALISSSNNTITGNAFQGNTYVGIYLLYSSDNNTIVGNTVQGNAFVGIYLYDTCFYNTVSGNAVEGNSGSGILLIDSGNNNTIIGNTVQENAEAGIALFNASNNSIIGNKFRNNGGSGNDNGITIDPGSDTNLISSNDITDATGTGFAISVSSATCDNNYLVGNRYSGTGASSIQDLGTGTVFGPQLYGTASLSTSTASDLILKPVGNVGIGSTSTSAKLTVQQDAADNIVDFKDGGTSVFTIANGGNVTVAGNVLPSTTTTYNLGSSDYKWANIYAATTTIGGTITIGSDTFEGDATTTLFTTGNANQLVLGANGNVGIGTTAPVYRLDVLDASNPQLGLINIAGSATTTFWVDNVGDLRISASGGDIKTLNENLWVCSGDACAFTTTTDKGNIIAERAFIWNNQFELRYESATSVALYSTATDTPIIIFDEEE